MNRLFLLFTTSLLAQAVHAASYTEASAPWSISSNKASELPSKDKDKLNTLLAFTKQADEDSDWKKFNELIKELIEQMARAKSGYSASGMISRVRGLSADDRIQAIKDSVAYIKRVTMADRYIDDAYRRIEAGFDSILYWPKEIDTSRRIDSIAQQQKESRATTKIISDPYITFQNGTKHFSLYIRIHEGRSSVVPKRIGPGETKTVLVMISGSGLLNAEIRKVEVPEQWFLAVKAPSGGWHLGKDDKIVLRENPLEMVLIRANAKGEEKLDIGDEEKWDKVFR